MGKEKKGKKKKRNKTKQQFDSKLSAEGKRGRGCCGGGGGSVCVKNSQRH